MIFILGILLIVVFKKFTSKSSVYSSFPSILNLLYLMLYLPILIAGIWCLGYISKKLRVLFPEKYPPRGPITKKRVVKESSHNIGSNNCSNIIDRSFWNYICNDQSICILSK